MTDTTTNKESSDEPPTLVVPRWSLPDRLTVASDAWLALDPFENPEAPATPFAMEEYVVPAAERAAELELAAEDRGRAQHATERANEFVLMTVLFATVLLFASISGKLTSNHNRAAILAVALIGLIAWTLILLTYPSAPRRLTTTAET